MKSLFVKTHLISLILLLLGSTLSGQMLLNECKVTIDASGKKKTTQTYRIQVNNKQSNWLAEVSIPHTPKQKFTLKYATIFDQYGEVVRKVKKKELTTRNRPSRMAFFQDDLISELSLYHSSYPYQIEYSYDIVEDEYMMVEYWSPRWYSRVPTIKGTLEIVTPIDFKISIENNGDFEFKEAIYENTKIYRWTISSKDEIKEQLYGPNSREIFPYVKVVSDHFTYGVRGSHSSWAAFGKWKEDLNKGNDDLTQKEKIKIEKMVEGVKDKREIIKTLYRYLQDNTKYVYVGIEEGGLQSFPASYVCENKFGDCKALSTYMQSMLKSLGIESNYTTIYSDDNPVRVNEELPSHQSNHVVLSIPLENEVIWLENTSNSSPFNYAGTHIQNRKALAIDGLNSKLISTPALSLTQVLVEREYNLTQNNKEVWEASTSLAVRGSDFESIRYYKKNNLEEKLETAIIDVVSLDDFELDEWEFQNFHRDSTNVQLEVNGICKHPIRDIAGMQVINPLQIKLPDFEKPKQRVYDVRINFPVYNLDKLTYNFQNLESKEIELPEAYTLDSKYGQYKAEYKNQNNSIEVVESFKLFAGDIALKDYSELYQFIESIKNHKKQSAIIIQ